MVEGLMENTPTMADILGPLGDIPPNRVLMKPTPGKATEKDLLRFLKKTGRLCELVDGTLVEKPVGYCEGTIAAEISMHLRLHAKKHKLGNVAGADATMRLWKGLVRMPDVSFVKRSRFPDGVLPREAIPDLAPDLAVEVLSKSNTPGEIQRKLKEYFLAGTTLAWIVDPERRDVRVHTAPDVFSTLSEEDTLDGGDLLPGFTLPIRSLFEELAPPEKKRPVRRRGK